MTRRAGAVRSLSSSPQQAVGRPYHVHRDQDESFYVLEGEMTFYVGDAVIEAKAGSFAFGPRNLPHTFVVGSHAPARYLLFTEPGGFDRFVAEVGEPAAARTLPPPLGGPPDIAAISAIAAKHAPRIRAEHAGREYARVTGPAARVPAESPKSVDRASGRGRRHEPRQTESGLQGQLYRRSSSWPTSGSSSVRRIAS
jgi:hypothetical protein